MARRKRTADRRNVLASIGTASLGLFSVVGTASGDLETEGNYMPCCGGGGGSSTLDSDSSSVTQDVFDGEYTLESTVHASLYNSWHDEGGYCDYIHRIHFGATGNTFVDDGDEYLTQNSLASNELVLDVSGDIVETTQQNHNEAIGAYESFEEESSDVDEDLVETAVDGAVGVGTTLAFANPVSAIAASMAFTYITERTADENDHYYNLMWNWINNVGDPGEGAEDSCVFARMDVTTRVGDSADIDASAQATDIGSSSAVATANFTVDAPTDCQDPDSLNTQSLHDEGLLRITEDEITTEQQEALLGEEPLRILNESGSLTIKRDTTVGQIIQEMRNE